VASCDGYDTISVRVNPTPVLSGNLIPSAICSNTPFTFTPSSSTNSPTPTFTWTRATVANVSPSGSNGSGSINETFINSNATTTNVTYTYTLVINSCSTTNNVVVPILPNLTLNSGLIAPAICNGATFTYAPTSQVSGVNFSWSRSSISGITQATSSGTGSISEVLNNTTTEPITVTYVYTLTANGCSKTTNITVAVNPTPILTSLLSRVVCNNAAFTYTATSATANTTFSWTRATVSGISNSAGNGTSGIINETLINTTTAPIVVNYQITLTANGCSNTQTLAVTVNPTPILSSGLTNPDICSPSAFSYTPNSATVGATYSWTRSPNSSITPTPSGSSNVVPINETLTNTSHVQTTVTYNIITTANNCSNTAQQVTVVVNPKPLLTTTTATVCNNSLFNYTAASTTPTTTFTWSRAVVANISNPSASGTNTINETLINTSNVPVVVTYSFVLTAYGCTNNQTLSVTVYPTPVLSSLLLTAATCSEQPFVYTPSFAVTNTTYSWTRAAVSGVTPTGSNGTGVGVNETLVNSNATTTNVTYLFTMTANSCNYQQSVVVPVYPNLTLNSVLSAPAICNGATFNYTPTSQVSGVNFSWSRSSVSGITPSTSSGTGSISEVLNNTTTAPITVTYAYTLTANGCSKTTNITVVVNPTPVLNSSLTGVVCNNTPYAYTATSATTGSSFTWTRAFVNGITNAAASGSGNISEVLLNPTTAPIAITYQITSSANGCVNPNAQTLTVTVNPTPTLSSSLTPPVICSANPFLYTPVSATLGATYFWTRVANGSITPAPGASSNVVPINEILTNALTSTVNVTYNIVTTANGCSNLAQQVVVSVNPSPSLSSSTSITQICSNSLFNYTPASTTSGATFTWTRAAVAGISTPASSGTNGISEALENTTALPITVDYTYTISANNCSRQQTVSVIVKPNPTLSSTLTPTSICSGTNFSYTSTSGTTGVTYSWVRPSVIGINNNNASSSGAINTGVINEVLTNSTFNPIVVSYNFTITANGCSSNQTVNVTVNPKPVATPGINYLCNGDTSQAISFSGNGVANTTYTWSNNNTNIGLAASGSGSIPLFVATNTTANQISGVVTISSTANGCSGTPVPVIFYVSATPVLTSLQSVNVTSNTTFTYTPTSSTTGATFSWTRAAVVGISNTTGSGTGVISETLVNTTANPIVVTYVYTLTTNGCTNTQTLNVSVNPSPAITSPINPPAICSGTLFSYTASSATNNVQFSWTRAAIASINAGASGSGTGASINEILTSTSAATVSVPYVITMNINGTIATQTITIQVLPKPILSSLLTASVCSDLPFNYTATSATTGTTFSWTRAVVPNITNAIGSNTSNGISETLTNTSTSIVNTTYVISMLANGCPNTQNVVVAVNPTPVLSNPMIIPATCSGSPFSFNLSSLTSGVTYSWSRAVVIGISNAAGTGSGATIAESLNNTTTAPITVSYLVTLTANGCSNTQTLTVTVNPKLTLNLTSKILDTVCNLNVYSYIATSATTGATFSWTRAAVAGINNLASSGNSNIINETLQNSTANPIAVTYVFTITANGCSNTQNLVVWVFPTPYLNGSLSYNVTSGTVFTYSPTSNTNNLIYTWTRAAVAGISNTATSGNGSISETLVNTTFNSIVVQYQVTLTINGCSNTQTLNVTVNPLAGLSSPLINAPICSNTTFSYTPTSSTSGVIFSWTRANIVGITNPASSGSGSINEVLVNTTPNPINVIYTYALNINGTVTSQNISVIINPSPVLSSSLTPNAVCSNTSFLYTATSVTTGVVYSWTRAMVTGISNAGASGSNGVINEVLINTTPNPVNVTYVFTLTANGCTNIQNVVVSIKPTPVLSSTLTPNAVCSNAPFIYTPTSLTTGFTYTWVRSAQLGISNPASNGNSIINETLIDTTQNAILVPYSITLTASACVNTQIVNVLVNPLPISSITAASGTVLCSGNSVTMNALINANQSYQWFNGNTLLVGATTPSYTTSQAGNYTVVVTNTNTSCLKLSNPISVVVNPLPNVTVSLSGPTTFCLGDSIILSVPFSATQTYQWSDANGIIANATLNSIKIFNSGTYSVKATITGSGCFATSAATTITVNSLPAAVLTANGPTTFCQNGSVLLTATTGVGYTYIWYKNGVIIPSQTSSSYNAITAGLYTVSVINSNGCAQLSNGIQITVNPLPIASVSPSNTYFCAGGTTTITAVVSPNVTYQWTLNNVNIPGAIQSTLSVNQVGVYNVKVTDAVGCVNISNNAIIYVRPLPNAVITPLGPTSVCINGVVGLLADTNSSYQYQWQFNGSNSIGDTSFIFNTTNSGNYTYTVTDTFGCVNTSAPVNVIFSPIPIAIINAQGATTFCQGGSVLLTGNNSPGATYQWVRNGVDIPNANLNSYVATIGGSYTLRVCNLGCCSISPAINVVVDAPPTAVIIPSSVQNICFGTTTTLYASIGLGYQYQWQVNGIDMFGATNNTLTVTNAGIYTVRITKGYCTVYAPSVQVNVQPLPSAVITTSVSPVICQGDSLQITANVAPGYTYQWYYNNTLIPNVFTSAITVSSAGSYKVKITNIFGCEKESNIINVSINPLPTASILPNGATNFCNGQNVVLNANTGIGLTYQWLNNNAPITAATSNTLTVNTSGSYAVVVSNANGCVKLSNTIPVVVNPVPVASLTALTSNQFCAGDSVKLQASIGLNYTYKWYKNGVLITGATNVIYTATQSGIYAVEVKNQYGCTAISNSITVTVAPLPIAQITALSTTSFCLGDSVKLQAVTGLNYTYQWYKNGNMISTASLPSLTVTSSGAYYVVVFNNNACFLQSNTINVNVNPLPIASLSNIGDTTFCDGDSVKLVTSNMPGQTYQWFKNGLPIANANAFQLTIKTAGAYYVRITTQFGCTSISRTQLVVVKASPTNVISVNGPTTKCIGETIELSVPFVQGNSYQWYQGNTQLYTQLSNVLLANTTASYYVLVTNSNGCSKIAGPVFLTFVTYPTASISPKDSVVICEDNFVTLIANSDQPVSVTWTYNGTNLSQVGTTLSTNISGVYSIIVENQFGCKTTASTSTKVISVKKPIVILTHDTTVFAGDAFQINVKGDLASKYEWSPIDYLSCINCRQPICTPERTITYKLEASNIDNCIGSDTMRVHVICNDKQFYIPNMISPNGDGNNDVFYVRGKGVRRIKELKIFDRFGKSVFQRENFEANNIQYAWDGTINGTLLDAGVFFYYVEIECILGDTFIYKGDITILK
jgi:gliding motility-associated-like protein